MYDRGGESDGDGGPIVMPGEVVFFFGCVEKDEWKKKKKLLKYLRRTRIISFCHNWLSSAVCIVVGG